MCYKITTTQNDRHPNDIDVYDVRKEIYQIFTMNLPIPERKIYQIDTMNQFITHVILIYQ